MWFSSPPRRIGFTPLMPIKVGPLAADSPKEPSHCRNRRRRLLCGLSSPGYHRHSCSRSSSRQTLRCYPNLLNRELSSTLSSRSILQLGRSCTTPRSRPLFRERAGERATGRSPSLPLPSHESSSLLLQGNTVYVAFTGAFEQFDYHGWVFGFNADTLASVGPPYVVNANGDGGESGSRETDWPVMGCDLCCHRQWRQRYDRAIPRLTGSAWQQRRQI